MIILLAGFILFLLTISILKSNGHEIARFQIFRDIPYYDKLGHFLLMGVLGFLLVAVVSPLLRKKVSKTLSILIPTCSLVILIGVEEYSQQYLSSRSCSWADFGFGVVGILFFVGVYLLSFRRKEVF